MFRFQSTCCETQEGETELQHKECRWVHYWMGSPVFHQQIQRFVERGFVLPWNTAHPLVLYGYGVPSSAKEISVWLLGIYWYIRKLQWPNTNNRKTFKTSVPIWCLGGKRLLVTFYCQPRTLVFQPQWLMSISALFSESDHLAELPHKASSLSSKRAHCLLMFSWTKWVLYCF